MHKVLTNQKYDYTICYSFLITILLSFSIPYHHEISHIKSINYSHRSKRGGEQNSLAGVSKTRLNLPNRIRDVMAAFGLSMLAMMASCSNSNDGKVVLKNPETNKIVTVEISDEIRPYYEALMKQGDSLVVGTHWLSGQKVILGSKESDWFEDIMKMSIIDVLENDESSATQDAKQSSSKSDSSDSQH